MNRAFLRNTFGAILALLLLAPVPAFALTFLGGWNFFQSVPGIATIFPPSDAPEHYMLKIGMGQIPPPSVTKLSVTATRDFQITSPSQLISIRHMFGSFLQSGSINVTLSIQRFNVPNDPFNFPPYSFSTLGTANPSLDFTKFGTLTQGLYRVTLTITYTCKSTPLGCAWNNSSPHTFNFDGY
jgi:hypothetical protein